MKRAPMFAVMIEREVDGALVRGLLDLRTKEIDANTLCLQIVASGDAKRAWYDPREIDGLPIEERQK